MKHFLLIIGVMIMSIGGWHSLTPYAREYVRVFMSKNKAFIGKIFLIVFISFCLWVVSVYFNSPSII